MEKPKFKIGDIVRIINGGVTFPFLIDFFKKLNFQNKQINKWRHGEYRSCQLLFVIQKLSKYYDTNVYKVVSLDYPDIEYLIREDGLLLIKHNFFKKIKII